MQLGRVRAMLDQEAFQLPVGPSPALKTGVSAPLVALDPRLRLGPPAPARALASEKSNSLRMEIDIMTLWTILPLARNEGFG